jgi:hypothetical protein
MRVEHIKLFQEEKKSRPDMHQDGIVSELR